MKVATIQTAIALQDNFSSILYGITNAMNISLSVMEDLNATMNSPLDTAYFEAAREEINQATIATQEWGAALQGVQVPQITTPQTSRPNSPSNQAPAPAWQSYSGVEVFSSTGIERFEQEISSVNAMLDSLSESQSLISRQANESEIISPQAQFDIENVENRLTALQERIRQAETWNVGTDEANAQMERLRLQLDDTLGIQERLNQAMAGMDVGDINSAYLDLSNTVTELERSVRDSFSEPVQVPVTWQTQGLEVFTNSGIERFRQEVQSANSMMNTLNQTQSRIAATAASTDLFPESAVADMSNMQNRLQAIQQRIQQIESNPMNLGSATANSELEQLRGRLNQAVQEQENLNRAVERMDVSAANAAYLRLSNTIGATEGYIRDNIDEQGRFNQAIEQGTQGADNLASTIKRAIAAYATIQTVRSVLDLSDTLTSTTARLNMMNDGMQTTQELQDMIYASAERSRGAYQTTADTVSKLGLMAGDAFSSSAEIIAFTEQLNKQFTIAGTEASGIDAAMLQLTQAMGSGVLRGEEYNSILEQAPNIIQSISKYIEGNSNVLDAVASEMGMKTEELAGNVQGNLKDIASEGLISAEMVKAAMFAAADETNAKFESMPMTFSQIWTHFQNTALVAFQSVLQRLNEFANSDSFQSFVDGAIRAVSMIATITIGIFDLIASVGNFIGENWSIIEPIIMGIVTALGLYYGAMLLYNTITAISAAITAAKAISEKVHAAALAMQAGATFAATAAQYGFNAALLACPLTWIVILIIAVVAAIFAVCTAIAKLTGIADSGFGVITGGISVVVAFFKNLGLTVANIALGIGSAIAAVAANIMTAFSNAITSVQSLWYDLLSTVLNVVAGICEALNKLPFIEFDYSGITTAANEYAAKAEAIAENKKDYQSVSDAFEKGFNTFDTFQDGWISDAFASGSNWGDGVADKVSNAISGLFKGEENNTTEPFDYASLLENSNIGIGDTSKNTGKIADSMEIAEEELEYLRDMAEQEIINRFTTAELTVNMGGITNQVNSYMDLDGIGDYLDSVIAETLETAAEGVY